MTTNQVLDELRAALPAKVVITDPALLADRITDVSGVKASDSPLALLRFTNTDQSGY